MNQEKILITGAEGFIGSNLVEYLLTNTNYTIFSMSRNAIKTHRSERLVSISHDMLKAFSPSHASLLGGVEYVVHLAGASCVRKSILNPLETINNNIVLTSNFLEFARLNMLKLKKILFLNTAEVFGPSHENKKFKEDDRYCPHSPYAATKAAIAQICTGYFKTYGTPIIVAHVMNTYGKNQSEHKFIPKIINSIKNNNEIMLHANKGPDIRNYLHVDDLCNGIVYLLSNADPGEKYNLISDTYTNNLEISRIIAEIVNKKLNYNLVSSKKHHTLTLLSGQKMHDLGWRPSISLKEGLEMVINEK